MNPTYRSLIVSSGALLSLGLGVILSNIDFLALSEFLLVFLIFARIAGGNPHTKVALSYARKDAIIYEDQTFDLTLFVRNEGQRLHHLEVILEIPRGLEELSGFTRFVADIPRGKQMACRLTFSAKRFGTYTIGPVHLYSFDLFGLFVEAEKRELSFRVRVFPKIEYPKALFVRPKVTKSWPGETVTRKIGSGMEFFSIREYSQGDMLRVINWKATARAGKLMANQFTNELGGDVVIAVDLRNQSAINVNGEQTDIHARRAAAILSYKLLRDRNRVGMIVLGHVLVKVPPGFGKRHLDRILSALIGTETGGVWEIENLPKFISLFFPKFVYVVVISPLGDQKSYNAVLSIALKGYPVLLVSPSPVPATVPSSSPYYVVGRKLLAVQRQLKLNSLRRYMTVVDWDTTKSFSEAMSAALTRERVRAR